MRGTFRHWACVELSEVRAGAGKRQALPTGDSTAEARRSVVYNLALSGRQRCVGAPVWWLGKRTADSVGALGSPRPITAYRVSSDAGFFFVARPHSATENRLDASAARRSMRCKIRCTAGLDRLARQPARPCTAVHHVQHRPTASNARCCDIVCCEQVHTHRYIRKIGRWRSWYRPFDYFSLRSRCLKAQTPLPSSCRYRVPGVAGEHREYPAFVSALVRQKCR